jgi:hypothetical protein
LGDCFHLTYVGEANDLPSGRVSLLPAALLASTPDVHLFVFLGRAQLAKSPSSRNDLAAAAKSLVSTVSAVHICGLSSSCDATVRLKSVQVGPLSLYLINVESMLKDTVSRQRGPPTPGFSYTTSFPIFPQSSLESRTRLFLNSRARLSKS